MGSQHLHFSAKIYEQGNELTKASVVYLFYACGLLVLTINIALCHLVRIKKEFIMTIFVIILADTKVTKTSMCVSTQTLRI